LFFFWFQHKHFGRHIVGRFVCVRVSVANFHLRQLIRIDETNTFQLKYIPSTKVVGATGLGGWWPLEWTRCWNQLALRKKLRNLHAKSQ